MAGPIFSFLSRSISVSDYNMTSNTHHTVPPYSQMYLKPNAKNYTAQVNRKIPRTVAHYSISPKTQDIRIFCSIKLNNMKNKAVVFPSCN